MLPFYLLLMYTSPINVVIVYSSDAKNTPMTKPKIYKLLQYPDRNKIKSNEKAKNIKKQCHLSN